MQTLKSSHDNIWEVGGIGKRVVLYALHYSWNFCDKVPTACEMFGRFSLSLVMDSLIDSLWNFILREVILPVQ